MEIKEIDVETVHEPLISPVPDKEVLPSAPKEPVRPVRTPEREPAKV